MTSPRKSGRKLSIETRRKMSEVRKGKRHSIESRLKMSESMKISSRTKENRERVSRQQKGKIVSEETRKKLSIANKGRVLSIEQRERIRMASIGKALPLEFIRRMKEEKNAEVNPNWKGGKKYRRVVQRFIGRDLQRREIIHHLDKDRNNNEIENLYLFRHQAAHLRWHAFIARHKIDGRVLETNLKMLCL